ncbi:hypothetical protein F5Y19DRAFT_41316 [Xylariaceae sp. FL1651]|nr:hypothetical protein F5Y19DRAFT_41316 [Xylariaceae sp. FL1651]
MLLILFIWTISLVSFSWGNTEKTIFLGPPPMNIQPTHPTFNKLYLGTLTPDSFAIRTYLKAKFPNNESTYGEPSWFILDELAQGQRYEVRVCWAATQPTLFRLETYELETVFGSPELTLELSEYASSRQPGNDNHVAESPQPLESNREASILLLRIFAAANFYTTNQTLMTDVPPVFVDVILDPFILNMLPKSLLPTVIYIIAVAIFSWFLGNRISLWTRQLAAEHKQGKKHQ